MKNLIFTSLLSLISIFSFAQNEMYLKAMEKSVASFQKAATVADLQLTANGFERIAKAENKAWLPAYYQSLCYMMMAAKSNDGKQITTVINYLDKAQVALDQAQAIDENNSEIYTLQGYIHQGRVWEDPMNKGAEYTQKSFAAFGKAMALDPTNPRPYYLKGQHTFFMPVFFGGGADKALPLFQQAEKRFATFKKASSIHPNWGQDMNSHFLQRATAQ